MILDMTLLLVTFLLLILSVVATVCVFITIKYRVPPVPSGKRLANAMIQAAKIDTNENIYDLGCAFGGLLFRAQKKHPQNNYVGIDILGPAILYNRYLNRLKRSNIKFINQDFFTLELTNADVILVYLWPSIMAQIETDIWPTLKPGTRIVSHAFRLPNTKHTELIKIKTHQVYVYVR